MVMWPTDFSYHALRASSLYVYILKRCLLNAAIRHYFRHFPKLFCNVEEIRTRESGPTNFSFLGVPRGMITSSSPRSIGGLLKFPIVLISTN